MSRCASCPPKPCPPKCSLHPCFRCSSCECTCDEIVLVSADWDSDSCDATATFCLPSQCHRKAWLTACAQVRPRPNKCTQKEREAEVCLDCQGCFSLCIPKGTLALCLRLKIKPSRCDDECDDECEYCAVFSKLNGPCAFLSLAAAPVTNSPDAAPVVSLVLNNGPVPPDLSGIAWKIAQQSGQLLEWTDAQLVVDPLLTAAYAFFANVVSPPNTKLVWKSTNAGKFNIYNSTAPAVGPLSDTFPEDVLVTFQPVKPGPVLYMWNETFQFSVTAELQDATTGKVLCSQSIMIKNDAQLT